MTQENKDNVSKWVNKNISDVLKIVGLYGGIAAMLFTFGMGWNTEAIRLHTAEDNTLISVENQHLIIDLLKNLNVSINQKSDSMKDYNYYKNYWEQHYYKIAKK